VLLLDCSGSGGRVLFRAFWHGEAEADFTAFGGSAGFALEAFGSGLVATEAAHFFEDTFHLEFGLETFEGAVNGLSFANLNFRHTSWCGIG